MTPTIFGFLVCLVGLLAPRAATLHVQLALCLFGGTAALALPALGGATITPAVLFLPFLALRALLERRGLVSLRQLSRPAFLLILVAGWGVLTAICVPRFLEGQVQILAIDRTSVERGVNLFPLHPVSGNITQSCYALGGVCAFLSVRVLLQRRKSLQTFAGAALLLTGLNCVAALLNLGEFYLGFPSVLEHLRTASYRMFQAYEAGGLMRIQGTFPEAAAFAGFTLPLFAFAFSLWLSGTRTRQSGVLAFASLSFLLFSTSATAYAGLAGYLGVLALGLAWKAYSTLRVPRAGILATVAMFALAIAGGATVLRLNAAERVATFLDRMVFSKLASPSGIERTAWSAQAWSNFVDTYGLGVGLGSARASSFVLVLLSNVGLIGTLLFVGFLLQVWRHSDEDRGVDRAVGRAARQAVLATLIGASISGTVFDLGVAFYAFAAAGSLRTLDLAEPVRA